MIDLRANPNLLLTHCVTLGKLLCLSETQFPSLLNETKHTFFAGLLRREAA